MYCDACRLLKAHGVKVSHARAVRDPAGLEDEVARAVISGVPMVIVGGGDGSLSSAVDHLVGMDQVARFRPFRLTIEELEDGSTAETLDALEVRIANGGYHGGTELIDAAVDSGEIVIQAVVGTARAKLLWSWGLSMLGRDHARATVREFRGKSFRLTTNPLLPISIDGEVLAKTPITARVADKAIWMAVPA